MRMLDALDRVKDLDRWQFHPRFTSKMPSTPDETRDLTCSEIEAFKISLQFTSATTSICPRAG
jgi:hypothetical protein